jgi:hypothetical protein
MASWLHRDMSPFVTLDTVASWLGLNITSALQDADGWLNADHRHDAFVIAGIVCLLVALAQQTSRLASSHANFAAAFRIDAKAERTAVVKEHHRWVGACETRFWALVWLVAGLLSQLHEAALPRVLAALGVIAMVRFVGDLFDSRAIARDFQESRSDVGFTFALSIASTFAWAALTLTTLIGRFYGLLTQPRIETRSADKAS